jgi:hypothetical protein
MYILSGLTSMGKLHINSALVFTTIEEIQYYLGTITNQWDRLALCPEVFIIAGNKILPISPEDHRTLIYPHTYTSRNRKE